MQERQNPVSQQRTRLRNPGVQQNGNRQERTGRTGTMPMPGVITRPFAPDRSRFNRGEQTPGGAGRAGGGSAERPRLDAVGGSAERPRLDAVDGSAERSRPDTGGSSGERPRLDAVEGSGERSRPDSGV